MLEGQRVLLRPVRDDDLAPLLAMLVEDRTSRAGSGRWDEARVQRDLLDPQDDEVVMAIEVDGAAAGVLMVGEEEDPDYRCVSIDLASPPRTRAVAWGPRRSGS